MFLATSVIEARRTCVSKCGGESCIQPDFDIQLSVFNIVFWGVFLSYLDSFMTTLRRWLIACFHGMTT